jgi:hypothetical protein
LAESEQQRGVLKATDYGVGCFLQHEEPVLQHFAPGLQQSALPDAYIIPANAKIRKTTISFANFMIISFPAVNLTAIPMVRALTVLHSYFTSPADRKSVMAVTRHRE